MRPGQACEREPEGFGAVVYAPNKKAWYVRCNHYAVTPNGGDSERWMDCRDEALYQWDEISDQVPVLVAVGVNIPIGFGPDNPDMEIKTPGKPTISWEDVKAAAKMEASLSRLSKGFSYSGTTTTGSSINYTPADQVAGWRWVADAGEDEIRAREIHPARVRERVFVDEGAGVAQADDLADQRAEAADEFVVLDDPF